MAFAGLLALQVLALAGAPSAFAQDATSTSPAMTTVERSTKGPTAKSIRIGIYLNVQADCTSGILPAIRLVAAPANGTISIKRGKVTATNYKQCLALEVPGFIAFYQSRPDFVGTDMAIIEVKYPQGRTELQRITINVGTGSGEQKI
ncbi:MAG: hypothetical protein KGK01_13155 [Bradyrhizobium sp.]|nr:hypothetical protein [Pseudomonadota bacterium]MDE2066224.1 hypothetical protein [Bradyrhizobium sp.]MDE2243338.1 hypothetical protein [Bradyrhizobium sp.]MDE2470666.1 hypothetical protein [Bradyrhizobium sp.]